MCRMVFKLLNISFKILPSVRRIWPPDTPLSALWTFQVPLLQCSNRKRSIWTRCWFQRSLLTRFCNLIVKYLVTLFFESLLEILAQIILESAKNSITKISVRDTISELTLFTHSK